MFQLNRKFSSSELFVLVLILIFATNILDFNFFKLLLIVPIVLFIYLWKISGKWLVVSLILCCGLIFLQTLIVNNGWEIKKTYFSFLNDVVPIHQQVINYLQNTYPQDVAEAIGSIVFNHRDGHTFKEFSEFGVSHLLFISALHFSFLKRGIFKLTRSKPLVYLILFLYWASIDYSIPALKVLLFMFLSGKKRDDIRLWSLTALASLFFNPHIYKSISFLMSHFFSLLFILNRRIFSSKLTLSMANSMSAFILSTLFFLNFHPKKVYPLAILNTYIFTPIVLVIFLYFFCTWFISPLASLHGFVTDTFSSLNTTFALNANSISAFGWDYDFTHIGLAAFGLLWVILLGRCYGCTIQRTKDY